MTSHKPLSQLHPNFTGMFLWWSRHGHGNRKKKLKISSLKKTQELELRFLA
jgi:hypothetical protein